MANNEIGKFSYLVVDDDELSREVIGGTLNRLGANTVFFAEDAKTALRMAQQHRPDFVLLDIYMPEVDGWMLLDQLRQLLPLVAVVMVTGSRHPEDFTQSMDQRVDGYCVKPVMPDVLEKCLLSAWRRRQGTRHPK